jgi:hypothetical protein
MAEKDTIDVHHPLSLSALELRIGQFNFLQVIHFFTDLKAIGNEGFHCTCAYQF